jgi:rubrerythrin
MSITSFSADEIYEMAEQIERNGADFYRKAALGFDETGTKNMLLELAAMEDEHEKTFRELRERLTKKDRAATVFDPNNQAVLYLQAMAGGYVFDTKVEPAEKLSGGESLEEVLRFAIGLERDSIAFYVGLKEATPKRWGRDRIDWVIGEEISHVNTLSAKLAEIRGR